MVGRSKPPKPKVKTVDSGKAGRPKIIIDEEVAMNIHSYAAAGATWAMIAIKTGIGKTTLERSQIARDAYEMGIADANLAVGGMAFKMAKSGKSSDMTKFWMKCRAGWKENQGLVDVNISVDERPASELIDERLDALSKSMAERVVKEEND